jgi:hypothetical protein
MNRKQSQQATKSVGGPALSGNRDNTGNAGAKAKDARAAAYRATGTATGVITPTPSTRRR